MSDEPIHLAGENERHRCWCPINGSFVTHFVRALQLPLVLNAFQDCIQLWIVSPASRRTLDAVAPGSLRLYDGHLDLDLLALGDTRILIELDGPAVNLAVECFIHDLTLFFESYRHPSGAG